MPKLLTSNTKIDKSMKLFPEYEATILQLAPGKGVCVNYSNCIKTCLFFTGFGKFSNVQRGRINRTKYLQTDIQGFLKQLTREIRNQVKRAIKKNKTAVIRLNGFSDIDWSKPEYFVEGFCLFDLFPEVIFYDYTADYDKALNNEFNNYHLTFSYKGNNLKEANSLLVERCMSIAAIDVPENKHLKAMRDLQGDVHDFRFLDQKASIVWLSFKE